MLSDSLHRQIGATGADIADTGAVAQFTTLGLGGTARAVVTCHTSEQLIRVLALLAADPVLVLAGGSNVVIADGTLPLVVVRIAATGVVIDGDVLTAQAGTRFDDVVAAAISAGLGGLECLSGIPGSVGATPVQNVGAYGVEVASVLDAVQLYDRATQKVTWVPPASLELGYRHSNLKRSDRAVVLAVRFRLHSDGLSAPIRYGELSRVLGATEGERAPIARVREAVLGLRAGKAMVYPGVDHDSWSVGSFFTNPVVRHDEIDATLARIRARVGEDAAVPSYDAAGGIKLSAGWLIERAGFGKGYPGPQSPVRLSTRHTLALTHRGGGTTTQLLDLAREVRDGVQAAFGVGLVPEPVLVGCEL